MAALEASSSRKRAQHFQLLKRLKRGGAVTTADLNQLSYAFKEQPGRLKSIKPLDRFRKAVRKVIVLNRFCIGNLNQNLDQDSDTASSSDEEGDGNEGPSWEDDNQGLVHDADDDVFDDISAVSGSLGAAEVGAAEDGGLGDVDHRIRRRRTSEFMAERQSLAEPLVKKLGKRQRNRDRARLEILETERTFVHKLETLVDVFEKPMTMFAAQIPSGPNTGFIDGSFLSPQELGEIFSNSQEILELNKVLLAEIEQAHAADEPFGPVFLRYADQLLHYTNYLKKYSDNEDLRKRIDTNVDIAGYDQQLLFIKALELQPRCMGGRLVDYLMEPVSRVPRYILARPSFAAFNPLNRLW